MIPPLRTITLEILIPLATWRQLGTPEQVQQFLSAQGLWPAHVWEHRWREDGERQCLVVTLQVRVALPEKAPA